MGRKCVPAVAVRGGMYLLVFALLLLSPVAMAQSFLPQSREWSSPILLSSPGVYSDAPQIAADQQGVVHVIWGASMLHGSESEALDTAFYTKVTEGLWAEPIDIFAVGEDDMLIPDALEVDLANRLVFVWHQSRGFNVGVVQADEAGIVRAWVRTAFEPLAQVNGAGLAIDKSGAYHLVYVLENRALFYVTSVDNGFSWSDPVYVGGVESAELAISHPAIAVDDTGGLYVAWERAAEVDTWTTAGVWFTRSTDGGLTWDESTEMAGFGYGIPGLFVDDQQAVHLGWVGNIGVGGRYHRWSTDGGDSWSDTVVVAEADDIRGHSGAIFFLLDSSNALHAVFSGGRQGVGDQILHNVWSRVEYRWSYPESVSAGLPRSERNTATIALGYQLHTVWFEYASEGVWYSMMDTGAPPMDGNLPLLPTSVAAVSTMAVSPSPTATLVPSERLETNGLNSDQAVVSKPILGVVAGIFPALVVVVWVVVARLVSRHPGRRD